jgi:hypothetical protein
MEKFLSMPLVFMTLGALSACGGGGGGGGNGTSATLSSFSSWSAVSKNSTIIASGISQSGTFSYNLETDAITTARWEPAHTGASFTANYDQSGQATTVTISPVGQPLLTFTRNTDSFEDLKIDSSIGTALSVDRKNFALVAKPSLRGWDYQSFGIWSTGHGTGSGTFGAISFGAATSGGSIPTSGTATYTGVTGGRHLDGNAQHWFTASSMTAVANFGARSIDFITRGTRISQDLKGMTANSNLDMTGTLTYAAATNKITGSVSTVSGHTGTVTGQFYGPSAQEIGGTFSLTGGRLGAYAGAFGGKR